MADPCRFCFDEYQTIHNPLIAPCKCNGSIKYIHLKCLLKWIYAKREPTDICNMCHNYYIYTINNLEESHTFINKYVYYNSSTLVAALWLIPIYAIRTIIKLPIATIGLTVHGTTCAYYFAMIIMQTKSPLQYIYYYFKYWNIHLLALCATFITQSRYMHLEGVVTFYYFLNCCILYAFEGIDKSIRERMNRKIIRELVY